MLTLEPKNQNHQNSTLLSTDKVATEDQHLGKAMLHVWVLRLLCTPFGFESLTNHNGFTSGVMTCIGRTERGESYETEGFMAAAAEVAAIRPSLPAELRVAEANAWNDLPQVITRNVRHLAHHLDLSAVEETLLLVVVMGYQNTNFRFVLSTLTHLGAWQAKQLFAVIIAAHPDEVRSALSPQGTLIRSGLLVATQPYSTHPSYELSLLSDYFAERVLFPATSAMDLLADHITPVAETLLTRDDFAHINHEFGLLQSLLACSLKTQHIGCNVLIYGVPGTGKTELTRLIAKALGYDLYDIRCVDADGRAIKGLDRLQAYVATQHLVSPGSSLIVFDELEDLFNDSDSIFGHSAAQRHKGRMTRLLEENVSPTLWISNSIDCLDSAFVRRFDLIIELPIAPYEQRAKMLEPIARQLGISNVQAHRISLCPTISPAIIERSAASIMRMELPAESAPKALHYLINSTLKAQQHKPMVADYELRFSAGFDPSLMNIEGFACASELADLAEQLAKLGRGRLCLHGPSGTGKTAFAHWLASHCARPLTIVCASDLLSAQIGATEENIAQVFKRAELDKAVLIIDEVDSFLRTRERADKSWEITAVNEMLVQIERFSGVLLVTTNLFDSLDAAALRRFDMKLSVGYLKPTQAVQLLHHVCHQEGITGCDSSLEQELAQISNITVGDFAAMRRYKALRPIGSAALFVDALRAECALKAHMPKRAMGFIGGR